jgi:Uma2 family endonuclease
MDTHILPTNPWVARRRIDVDEYHRMGEAGILTREDRVELIEGELVAMSPIGSEHSGTVNVLNRMLVRAVGDRALVSVQNPVRLDRYSEPEPDFLLLRPRADDYRRSHPTAEDVLLAIEVSESSLRYDRTVKRALYASHAIAEFWIVNLADGEIEIARDPAEGAYREILRVGREARLEPRALPGVAIPAAALLE